MNRLRRSGNAPSAAKAFDQWMRQIKRAELLGMDVQKFIDEHQPKSASADDMYKAAFRARKAVDMYESVLWLNNEKVATKAAEL